MTPRYPPKKVTDICIPMFIVALLNNPSAWTNKMLPMYNVIPFILGKEIYAKT